MPSNALKAVEAGHALAGYAVKLREDEAGGRTDGGYGASLVIMLLHHVHEHSVACEVAGAGHSPGEYHYVPLIGAAVQMKGEIIEGLVDSHRNPVRGHNERFVAKRDEFYGNASPAEDVGSGEGLDILEAFSQENINSFHLI